MARFIRIPFGLSGDRTAVPDAVQPGGEVSFSQGFGPDYEIAPGDPGWKPVPRDESNGLYFDIFDNIRQYQLYGVPEWVDASQNAGVAVSYPIQSVVRHNDIVYRSIVANNTVEPGTDPAKWMVDAPFLQQIATDAEVQAGTVTDKLVTPANLNSRTATLTRTGLVELATTAETQAGVDATRAVTPAGLKSAQTGLLNATYLTVSGNFVVPAGVTRLFVKVIGGGGGGGGGSAALRHGGGGGGGGVAEGFITVTPGDVMPAVVGTGGAGAAIGQIGFGGAGSSSSFGGLSATGGGGGGSSAANGVGGTSGVGSGGSLNYGMGDGMGGNTSAEISNSGIGGGFGGAQGRAGQSPGSGGGGGYDSGGAGSVNAGNGAAGLVAIMY